MNFFLDCRRGLAVSLLLFVPFFTRDLCLAQSSSDSPRKILVRMAPHYPSLAASMALEGTVRADVLVAPDGSMKSASFKGGHPLFVQAAQKALSGWRWEVAPRETHETIDLKFSRPSAD
jgi:TonB family protein